MHPPDLVIATPADLRRILAERIGFAGQTAVARRGRFALAVTGGSTFADLGGGLVESDLPWGAVYVFWGDERAVPPDDPESNYRVASRVWLDRVPVPATQVYRMPADEPDLDAAARAYATTLARVLGPDGRLDAIILGTGADGHVCSLFADSSATAERDRAVVAVLDSPKPPARRLTLTLPVITRARDVIVMALGAAKREAVRDALWNPRSTRPLALALRLAASAVVLLDPDADPGKGV